jgi:hypothetical protein
LVLYGQGNENARNHDDTPTRECEPVHAMKSICGFVVQLAKQVWTFPKAIATCFRNWRQQAAWNEAEAERLDRIRHPSKYLGK